MIISLKLISAYVLIDLEHPITFNKIIIRKFRHRVNAINRDIYFVAINDFNNNVFYDGMVKIPYMKSIMSPDNINSMVLYENKDDKHDYIRFIENTITYLNVNIKSSDNNFDYTITPEYPVYLELEFI